MFFPNFNTIPQRKFVQETNQNRNIWTNLCLHQSTQPNHTRCSPRQDFFFKKMSYVKKVFDWKRDKKKLKLPSFGARIIFKITVTPFCWTMIITFAVRLKRKKQKTHKKKEDFLKLKKKNKTFTITIQHKHHWHISDGQDLQSNQRFPH